MNDPTNTDRAMWAQAAVNAFAEVTRMDTAGEDAETILGDLLADLRHWALLNDIDYAKVDAGAQENFEHEQEHDAP